MTSRKTRTVWYLPDRKTFWMMTSEPAADAAFLDTQTNAICVTNSEALPDELLDRLRLGGEVHARLADLNVAQGIVL